MSIEALLNGRKKNNIYAILWNDTKSPKVVYKYKLSYYAQRKKEKKDYKFIMGFENEWLMKIYNTLYAKVLKI